MASVLRGLNTVGSQQIDLQSLLHQAVAAAAMCDIVLQHRCYGYRTRFTGVNSAGLIGLAIYVEIDRYTLWTDLDISQTHACFRAAREPRVVREVSPGPVCQGLKARCRMPGCSVMCGGVYVAARHLNLVLLCSPGEKKLEAALD